LFEARNGVPLETYGSQGGGIIIAEKQIKEFRGGNISNVLRIFIGYLE